MYKIELSDGTVLSNVNLNGNNYIPKKLDKKVFKDNLDKVLLTDSDGSIETLYNQKVQFASVGGIETFILSEKTKDELEKEQLKQENEMLSEAVTELSMLISVILGGE